MTCNMQSVKINTCNKLGAYHAIRLSVSHATMQYVKCGSHGGLGFDHYLGRAWNNIVNCSLGFHIFS